jgi:hypothetical protein
MRRTGFGRIWAFATALVVILGFSILWGEGHQSKIKFKELTHSFGKIKQGAVLTYEFVFTNEGDAPLLIQKVLASCGCTAALVSDEKVAPGKQGVIEVKLDSQGYGGQISKVIYVDSNDPVQARMMLEITADIEIPPSPKIELDKYNYEGGLILEGEDFIANLKVMNKGEQELRVEFSHRNAAYFLKGKPASSPLKIAAGKEAEIEIRIPTDGRSGTLREYVLIKSNDPVRTAISLYTSGYIATKQQLKELFAKYKDVIK